MEAIENPTIQHIIFLGEAGFPKGFGAMQRMTLMARSLIHAGGKVQVVCRKGTWDEKDPILFEPQGTYMGIDYLYTSPSVFRPKGFIKRNIDKSIGILKEFWYLRSLKKQNKLDAASVSSMSSFHVFRYRLYSWLIGFPMVLNFVEMGSVMKGREGFLKKINDWIFENFIVKIVDGALPISEKLMSYYHQVSPTKPSMKLPILCDFEKFQYAPRTEKDIIFLYCGAASYLELVDFIIKAFDELEDLHGHVFLDLILGGKEYELKKISERIGRAKHISQIRFTSNVPHMDIPGHYSRASALLIPLRPTLQDEARFPHKIGEYLASGRPMITTAFGEVKHYDFVDQETALIADDYTVKAFSEKMRFVLDHPAEAEQIGNNGRQMGLENFDYTRHGTRLLNYFSGLHQENI